MPPTALVVCRLRHDRRRGRVRLRIALNARAPAHVLPSGAFVRYYAQQALVSPDDFAALLAALATPLPLDVRVSLQAPLSLRALNVLGTLAGTPRQPIGRLARAHTFGSPSGGRHQSFLQRQMTRGALERQERASMLPAVVLAPSATHRCLDMCAAPGSKSVQLLELLEQDARSLRGTEASSPWREVGRGCLVANDACLDRALALNRRCQGVNVASPFLLVTCLDARWLDLGRYKFDRVLCDVPCSGDGTLRKRHQHTPEWSAEAALALHATQLRLLRQGLHLLAPGGRLVYSTCSLNPVENEAVVAQALRGLYPLVDLEETSDHRELVGFHPAPGTPIRMELVTHTPCLLTPPLCSRLASSRTCLWTSRARIHALHMHYTHMHYTHALHACTTHMAYITVIRSRPRWVRLTHRKGTRDSRDLVPQSHVLDPHCLTVQASHRGLSLRDTPRRDRAGCLPLLLMHRGWWSS